ncbi:MAG TPA: chromophore lyase CpcT/CpeT [Bacteroidia bacterium]|nr:chromophore lyase CpcT/CpeT [Bacteroidia bacterium]
MKMLKSILLLSMLTNFAFAQNKKPSAGLTLLASYLQGTYNSEEQSKNDTDYFNISLVITPIWKHKNDGGYWFYVEQAMATKKEKPYRQRVYHVTQTEENTFESSIYTLTDPLRFAQKTEMVEELTVDSIQLKDGCNVILKKNKEGFFEGSTDEKKCASDLRGASYATSIVTLKENELLSWDQGFDKDDKQVWGATKGGYVFKKIKP